jgi:NADPH2:quinone reductase
MQAVRVHQPGGPEALVLEEIADPRPGPGQAVVRIEAAGLNFIDVYHRTGFYPLPDPPPFTLGQEGAGTVAAIGEGVSEVAVGDRVAWCGVQGAYAEMAAIPAARLVKLPAAVSSRQGAAVMLQGMTAHYLACSTRPLHPGDTCLIHAAAGGVGLLLCQIAKLRGARVFATVSTEAKAALAREAGADDIILYGQQDFAAEVKRATAGRGVAVIYDGVGQTTFEPGLSCLAPRGMMVLFGQSSGPVPPVNPGKLASGGSLYLTRPTLGHYIASREELLGRAEDLFTWIAAGKLEVRVGAEYALGDAAEAHRALEGRRTTGKVLLIP